MFTPRIALGLAGLIGLSTLPLCAQDAKPIHDPDARVERPSPKSPSPRVAAEIGFQELRATLLSDHADGSLPQDFLFAVSDVSELKQAGLGHGYRVHVIPPQEVMGGGELALMARPADIFHFQVLVAGRAIGHVEVSLEEGKWVMVGAGCAQLAQDVQAAIATHGESFRFMRSYQAVADMLEVRDAEAQTRYLPLVAARHSLGLTRTALSGREMVSSLQGAVRANQNVR